MTKCELLRNGSEDEALQLLQEDYSKAPSPSNMMSLSVGYMWTRRFDDASNHFREYLHSAQRRSPPMDGDGDYAFLGMAYGCLGDIPLAIATWKVGLKAPYSVAGVPVKLPILLHHASSYSQKSSQKRMPRSYSTRG
jgi:hypothetical protein